MKIRPATMRDLETVAHHDWHVTKKELSDLIERSRVIIAETDEGFAGWLRYGLFWDIVPFMNMLHLREEERGKGYGKMLVEYWENEMRAMGYPKVMTSSQSDEYAQHFYVKLGYTAVGSFLLRGDTLEILFEKYLTQQG